MKLTKLNEVISRLYSRNGLMGTSLFYSTARKSLHFTQNEFVKPQKNTHLNELYRRISPIGDPKQSITPILDSWIDEGNSVDDEQLRNFIKSLRSYKRYSHALQISMWMTDKRYYKLTAADIAIRLDLMSKVQSIEQVEKYFGLIPQQLKGLQVYGALLNCYAHRKCIGKAEAVMQKMRDLGFARMPLTYNVMLNLYYKTGNIEKFNALMHEMEEGGITYDKHTLGVQLNAYAAVADIKGIEETIRRMESDAVFVDWSNYFIAANAYTKAGLIEKAVEMLKKSERVVPRNETRTAYDFFLTQYSVIGKKDEVLRLWESYQSKDKVYNKGYMSIISSLLKLDDLESAEKIFEEWESQDLKYDMRIPNYFIGAYCKKGLVEKAKTFLDRAVSKGGVPYWYTWHCLAIGYLKNSQYSEAVEMVKKSIASPRAGSKLRHSIYTLTCCLEHLKTLGDLEGAEEFMKLLLYNCIISSEVYERLLNVIRTGKAEAWRDDDMVQILLDYLKSDEGTGDLCKSESGHN